MEVDVVKNLKAIEELKLKMLESQCAFQKGTINGSEAEMLKGLSELVALSYLVTRRLGLDFQKLDRTLIQRLKEWEIADKYNLDSQWGDINLLLTYLTPEQ